MKLKQMIKLIQIQIYKFYQKNKLERLNKLIK